MRRLALRWRIFWTWWGEAEAGSRRDYRLAHAYLRRRVGLEDELRRLDSVTGTPHNDT